MLQPSQIFSFSTFGSDLVFFGIGLLLSSFSGDFSSIDGDTAVSTGVAGRGIGKAIKVGWGFGVIAPDLNLLRDSIFGSTPAEYTGRLYSRSFGDEGNGLNSGRLGDGGGDGRDGASLVGRYERSTQVPEYSTRKSRSISLSGSQKNGKSQPSEGDYGFDFLFFLNHLFKQMV